MPREDIAKALLPESEIPAAWYNILPDLPGDPMPPLHPATMEPVGPQDLAPLFPEALIMQEVSTERFIDIPGPVLDVYRQWRPSPLYRGRRFERSLGLEGKQRIYYKWEGVSPAGSQAEHRRTPGLVQQGGRHQEAGDRDGRRPVGQRSVVCMLALRARVSCVHGQGLI